jgi:hypothetical protein
LAIIDDIRALVEGVNLESRLDDPYWDHLSISLLVDQIKNELPDRTFNFTAWEKLPCLDVETFRRKKIAGFSSRPAGVFMSMGDTPSKRYVENMELHDAVTDRLFDYFVPPIPDALHLMAMPTSTHWRYSAPARMFSRRLRGKPYDYAVTASFRNVFHIDTDAVIRHLDEAVESGQPTHIFTTSAGLAFMVGAIENRFRNFVLPDGSCVVHTGGLKGYTSRVGLARLPFSTAEIMGIPPWAVVSAYQMCELPTVFFTPNYRLSRQGQDVPGIAAQYHQMPPWTRAVVDKGRLAIFDLAAVDSYAFVRTPDKGEVDKQFIKLTD